MAATSPTRMNAGNYNYMQPTQSGYTVMHQGITCDGCRGNSFYGRRYKCLDCEDFDFCSSCKNTLSVRFTHPQHHEFFPIDQPGNLDGYLAAKNQRLALYYAHRNTQMKHLGITCNGCYARDFDGIRFKCLDCQTYELCETCEKSAEARFRHPIAHPFWPITTPGDLVLYTRAVQSYQEYLNPPPSVVHRSINCDVCGSQDIPEIRYKCLDCEDYDLCKTCEASPLCRARHNLSHSFWPIVEPGNLHEYQLTKGRRLRASISQQRPPPPQNQALHHNTSCHGCRVTPIIGVRWKCLDCDDFDFCVSCVSTPAKRDQHALNHVFYPIPTPDDLGAFAMARSRNTSGDPAPPPYTLAEGFE